MWPLWWWPHELMQPLMWSSMSPMSCSSSRSSKRSVIARRDRDRARVGERAEVAAGAGDHVGEQADVRAWRSSPRAPPATARAARPGAPTAARRFCSCVTRSSPALKRSARSAAASICVGGGVARRLAGALERQRHGAVAGEAVRVHVALEPAAVRGRRVERGVRHRRASAASARTPSGAHEVRGHAVELGLRDSVRGAVAVVLEDLRGIRLRPRR